ncbi:MAG: hypothetical protein LBO66_06045 [Deltaproteobacteria bacterium]|nr:hypothetical protein [Deltaproteobacteria bacterium]
MESFNAASIGFRFEVVTLEASVLELPFGLFRSAEMGAGLLPVFFVVPFLVWGSEGISSRGRALVLDFLGSLSEIPFPDKGSEGISSEASLLASGFSGSLSEIPFPGKGSERISSEASLLASGFSGSLSEIPFPDKDSEGIFSGASLEASQPPKGGEASQSPKDGEASQRFKSKLPKGDQAKPRPRVARSKAFLANWSPDDRLRKAPQATLLKAQEPLGGILGFALTGLAAS